MTGFLITIAISLIVAFIGDKIVRGTMPGGLWVTFLVALMGSWIGGYMNIFNNIGIQYDKLSIISSISIAIIFVFIYGFFRNTISQSKL